MQMKEFAQAEADFTALYNADDEDSVTAVKACFYKGQVLKKMDNFNDSVLHFEQVIRRAVNNEEM